MTITPLIFDDKLLEAKCPQLKTLVTWEHMWTSIAESAAPSATQVPMPAVGQRAKSCPDFVAHSAIFPRAVRLVDAENLMALCRCTLSSDQHMTDVPRAPGGREGIMQSRTGKRQGRPAGFVWRRPILRRET